MVRFLHFSLVARDAAALAAFYQDAFGLEIRRPLTELTGAQVGRGMGVTDAAVQSIWLMAPGERTPFLEIMQFRESGDRMSPQVNAPGWSHLAIAVPNLAEAVEAVVAHGGAMQGEVVDFGTTDAPYLIVYVRDPEGNVIELEQPPGEGSRSG